MALKDVFGLKSWPKLPLSPRVKDAILAIGIVVVPTVVLSSIIIAPIECYQRTVEIGNSEYAEIRKTLESKPNYAHLFWRYLEDDNKITIHEYYYAKKDVEFYDKTQAIMLIKDNKIDRGVGK